MSEPRWYHLFISHAWRYGERYDRLIELLDAAPRFRYVNWSAPEDKPVIETTDYIPNERIRSAIRKKIAHSHCVLVIAGM